MRILALFFALITLPVPAMDAQEDKFAPIDALLPAPDSARTVTGRPGPGYWQQRADFEIAVTLDVENLSYSGRANLTYTNNSPDTLNVIWLALDQNRFEDPAVARYMERIDRVTRRGGIDVNSGVPPKYLRRWQAHEDRDFGYRSVSVSDRRGRALDTEIEGTLMRVALAEPLKPGRSTVLNIDFQVNLVEAGVMDARSGYEVLAADGALIVGLAHWFPRPAAYTSDRGWHLEPFIEQGEMTTEFGDYEVAITVPSGWIVASTGALANAEKVLSAPQRERLGTARRKLDGPTLIVTPQEAEAARAAAIEGEETWVFKAEDVRDFAFAASPAFIWDAMGVAQDSREFPLVLAQSYYPAEGNPVWGLFSTEAVAHTLEVFTEFTFVYPYPQATAVNGVINSGMEYPMISFNAPRPHPEDSADGVYTARNKYGVIGIVIHETGHFYFPMIVNSDERLWMWMDEGLTSFVEAEANMRWEPNFDESTRRGSIAAYMARSDDQPIMSTADSLIARGALGYTKPATALFVLRELVLGRDAFDRAFAEYARAWAFKRPTPADFFRIMEQESGQDLDWFWRAWFFGTDHVDIAVRRVIAYDFAASDPTEQAERAREVSRRGMLWQGWEARNAADNVPYRVETRPQIKDVYTESDVHTPLEADVTGWDSFLDDLSDADRAAYERAREEGLVLNVIELENIGGIPTPVPLVLTYEDGTTEALILPVHIWRLAPKTTMQLFARPKAIVSVTLDPQNAMVDADRTNNVWPGSTERLPIMLSTPSASRPQSLMREERKRENAERQKR